jgi:hypothetical protein
MKSKVSTAGYLGLFCTPVLFLAGAPAMQRAVFKSRESAQATRELVAWSSNPRVSIGPLIARGADVNVRDGNGEPVLHIAVSRSLGEVRTLLDHGADVNAPGPVGRHSSHTRGGAGQGRCCAPAVEPWGNVDVQGALPHQGQHTALSIALANNGIASYAAAENYQKIIKLLKDAGAKE